MARPEEFNLIAIDTIKFPETGVEIELDKARKEVRLLIEKLKDEECKIGSVFSGNSRKGRIYGFSTHRRVNNLIEVSVFFWDENNLPVGERYFDLHVKTGKAAGGIHNFQRGIGAAKTIDTAAVEQLGRLANNFDKEVYWEISDGNNNSLKEIIDHTTGSPFETDKRVLQKKTEERERWLALYGPDGYFKNNYSKKGKYPRVRIPKIPLSIENNQVMEIVTGETLEDTNIKTAENANLPTKDKVSQKLEEILEATYNLGSRT